MPRKACAASSTASATAQFDYTMDDGAPLRVAVSVDRAHAQRRGGFHRHRRAARHDNFNAPPAVTRAAVLYVFRCLVGDDIPLNDGCLKPIELVIPPGTFLSPQPGAAVVAGNTEVSQATCNALFGALGAIACSQATMNNFLFGDATPAILRDDLRRHRRRARIRRRLRGADAHDQHAHDRSGGAGTALPGAAGGVSRSAAARAAPGGGTAATARSRRIRFLEPMTAVIVSSRRNVPPFGLAGGEDGAAGRQWVERADGSTEILTGTDSAELAPGDVFVIETPGGGGYGAV